MLEELGRKNVSANTKKLEATTLLGLKYKQSFLPQASKQPSLPKRLLKAIFSPC